MSRLSGSLSTIVFTIISACVLFFAFHNSPLACYSLLALGLMAVFYTHALYSRHDIRLKVRRTSTVFLLTVAIMPVMHILQQWLANNTTHILILVIYIIVDTAIGILSYNTLRDNLATWERNKARLDLITLSMITIMIVAVYTVRFIKPSFDYDLEVALLIVNLGTICIGIVTSSTVFNALFSFSSRRKCFFKAFAFTLYFYGALLRTGGLYRDDHLANFLLITFSLCAILIFIRIAQLMIKDSFCRTNNSNQPENFGSGIVLYIVFAIVLLFYVKDIVYFPAIIASIMIIVIYQVLRIVLQRNYVNVVNLHVEKQSNEHLAMLVEASESELRNMNKKLLKEANTDSLTGLNNRRYLYDYLSRRVAESFSPFALLLINLSRFKLVNDLYGHSIGDDSLVIISKRIADVLTKGDLVFRLGGDEFIVLVETGDRDFVRRLAATIIAAIEMPIEIVNYRFQCGGNIGIVNFPQDASTINGLMKAADLAVNEAKKFINRQPISTYVSHLSEREQRRNSIEFKLKQADLDREFKIHLQPIIDAPSSKLIAAEALLRWYNDELGNISPGEFIPIAEECHMIYDLTIWVIEQVFAQLTRWRDSNLTLPTVGINISPMVLSTSDFVKRVERLIANAPTLAAHIDLEITEHTAMASSTYMEEVLTHLKSLGFTISIDDFGTGYSSLNYIKSYDIDYLKIDKELIDHIVEDRSNRQIIKAIIAMAAAMDIATIAEGVESADQFELLKAMRCDRIQGYYFAKPMPVDTFIDNYLSEM